MKVILESSLKFQCHFIQTGNCYNGGWTSYKTKKARTNMFNKMFTMKNDVSAIDFIDKNLN